MFTSKKTGRRHFLKSGLLSSLYIALPGFIRAETHKKQNKASRYGEGLYGVGTYGKLRPLPGRDRPFYNFPAIRK